MSISEYWQQLGVSYMQYEKRYDIEPGLLNALKLYTTIGVVLGVIFFSLSVYQQQPDYFGFASLIFTVIQLVYLFVAWFQNKLGLRYVPVFFVYATVQMIASDMLMHLGNSPLTFEYTLDEVSVYLMLLLSPPLFFLALLISWQYSVRYTILFAIVTLVPSLIHQNQIATALGQSSLFVIIALVIRNLGFVTVGYFVTHLMKQQRQLRRELSAANQQIASFATMTESLTISRERNRMARELHDTLAHTLTASTVQLQAATTLWDSNPGKAHELVERSLNITRNSLDETRRALHDLRASPLENLGLLLAIRELGETTSKRTGSQVDMHLPEQMAHLPETVEQTIYRIVQESLENIVRHAHASCVTIQMSQQRDTISLSIQDDGKGFEVNQIDNTQRYGIRGMRERVKALGGRMELFSQPNLGTQVQFEIQI